MKRRSPTADLDRFLAGIHPVFSPRSIYRAGDGFVIRAEEVGYVFDPDGFVRRIAGSAGFISRLDRSSGEYLITLVRPPAGDSSDSETDLSLYELPLPKEASFPWVNMLLFLATALTTTVAGTWIADVNVFKNLSDIIFGIPFSVAIMSILLAHESGHFFAGRSHRIKVTIPYFIPSPPFFPFVGTFGAFIKSKSPFLNRRQLLDVGAAGPIAGFIVSIAVIIVGLAGSAVVAETPEAGMIILGDSLIFKLLSRIVLGPVPDTHTVLLNPICYAGWIGLLVTMLNLLPVGQLDGGHICYALLGKHHKVVAWATFGLLVFMGMFFQGWLIWAIIAIIMRPQHPPTIDDHIPLGPYRRAIAITCLLIFVLCFMPVPVKI